jgi:hypothetical protein
MSRRGALAGPTGASTRQTLERSPRFQALKNTYIFFCDPRWPRGQLLGASAGLHQHLLISSAAASQCPLPGQRVGGRCNGSGGGGGGCGGGRRRAAEGGGGRRGGTLCPTCCSALCYVCVFSCLRGRARPSSRKFGQLERVVGAKKARLAEHSCPPSPWLSHKSGNCLLAVTRSRCRRGARAPRRRRPHKHSRQYYQSQLRPHNPCCARPASRWTQPSPSILRPPAPAAPAPPSRAAAGSRCRTRWRTWACHR